MGTDSGLTARIERLRALYQEQFRESFDTGEFLSDDFYAFQVMERAFQVGEKNRELKNLALLMHAERKALMETGQRQTLDALKNAVLPPAEPPVPAAEEVRTAQVKSALEAVPRIERRVHKVSLTAREITLLSGMRRIYRRHFGQSFDVEEFAANDLYAKVVLTEAVSSGHPDLEALARAFLDANGKPRLHRRQGQVDVELGTTG